jgi:hypothetical protein
MQYSTGPSVPRWLADARQSVIVRLLMAAANDPRFDRAAARWVGRLLAETPIGLADGRYVLALVERLPQGAETIRRFARRR